MNQPTGAKGDLLLEIQVQCGEAVSVRGQDMTVIMIPFTAAAEGPLFSGKTVAAGTDTQWIGKDGLTHLSARYMLEGTDGAGHACRVFIENQGSWQEGFVPRIVTDSPLLKDWEKASLSATAETAPGGVTVRIYRLNAEACPTARGG